MSIAEAWTGASTMTAAATWQFSGRPTETLSGPEIEELDGMFTVHDPVTGIFGTGTSRALSLEDFMQALREHADVLGRQERLSPALADQLKYLRALLG